MPRNHFRKDHAMKEKPNLSLDADQLRRHAETCLRKKPCHPRADGGGRKSVVDTQRLLHELQVHQIELELQNAELQESRDRMEVLLEKYTDLFDFAPVGYFSLDEQGRILEVNLMGSTLLGMERSRVINQCLSRFVALPSRPAFLAFLEQVFAGSGKHAGEVMLLKEDGASFWASLHGIPAIPFGGSRKGCRVAVSDITSLKQAEEAQRRVDVLAASNQELRREIAQRQAAEEALRNSEQHQSRLLEQSRHMQKQLRDLSHRILQVQEEERKRISRELHDEITQTLVGINVRLESLVAKVTVNPKGFKRHITRTQRLVEKSVDIVHRFARELRPAALDDLGLIPALRTSMEKFMKDTGIRVSLTAFAGLEELSSVKRTVLYRVTQEALTNVARHAQASRVDVTIERLVKAVRMQIKDDGKSFEVERMWRNRKGQRLGLIGMRERVEMVGGTFTAESAPGKGTTLTTQIPFNNGTTAPPGLCTPRESSVRPAMAAGRSTRFSPPGA